MPAPAIDPNTAQNNILPIIFIGVMLFAGLFAILGTVISAMNYKPTPVRDRLMLMKSRDAGVDGKLVGRGPFDDMKDAIITFSGPLSQKLYGENKKMQEGVKLTLTEAGLPDSEVHVNQFLARRVAAGIAVGGFMFVCGLMTGNLSIALLGLIGGFLGGGTFYQMGMKGKAGKRKAEIRYKLPDTLDLMVVCVEAGLGLDSTINKVSEETEKMAPEISYEFKRLNKELNAGISRIEAFQNMGQRSGVDEMRSLCAMIVQADKMGTSVGDTLRIYADDLRVKRRQKAEELASKASIKMTFPLVFFIFPPLFMVLMGPLVIPLLSSMMGGGK